MRKIVLQIRTLLRSYDRGDVAVEMLAKLMGAICLIVLFMQIIPIVTMHTYMTHASESLARTIELTGSVNSAEYTAQLARYDAQYGFDFTVTAAPDEASGWFNEGEGKLAFRAPFTLVMEASHHITIPGLTLENTGLSIDIPIRKTVYGTSEIYWKH